MSQEQIEALKAAAEKAAVKPSEIIRRAVDAYLRTLSAVVCALVALVLLSGCAGTSQAATAPSGACAEAFHQADLAFAHLANVAELRKSGSIGPSVYLKDEIVEMYQRQYEAARDACQG